VRRSSVIGFSVSQLSWLQVHISCQGSVRLIGQFAVWLSYQGAAQPSCQGAVHVDYLSM
jgi:hypothetical protein